MFKHMFHNIFRPVANESGIILKPTSPAVKVNLAWRQLVPVKGSILTLFLFAFAAGTISACAQVEPSATAGMFSITVGGTVSAFNPDFAGTWEYQAPYYPEAQGSNRPLIGLGVYTDVRLSRWVQFEVEGRWQRLNRLQQISQDNYLAGPRLPLYRFQKATVYCKALVGFSQMNFNIYGDHGRFTTTAFGGGVDVKLSRKLRIRVADVEYQYWPTWVHSSLSPYGASVGIGYRLF
jgi:hypothetical protein